jgi:hypothetical protein
MSCGETRSELVQGISTKSGSPISPGRIESRIRFSIIAVMFLLVALVVYTFVTGVRWPAWTGFSEYNPADHGNRGS